MVRTEQDTITIIIIPLRAEIRRKKKAKRPRGNWLTCAPGWRSCIIPHRAATVNWIESSFSFGPWNTMSVHFTAPQRELAVNGILRFRDQVYIPFHHNQTLPYHELPVAER